MTPPLDFRILQPTDQPRILTWAKAELAERHPDDPTERELQSWSAPWRPEALDHYLTQGWSYGAFSGEELRGFVLTQPLLFVRGLMQTLWVEHLAANDAATARQLLDVACRWAKDKHFQCVLGEATATIREASRDWPSARVTETGLMEIKTARYK